MAQVPKENHTVVLLNDARTRSEIKLETFRLKCPCGENIVKKGIVRNKVILLTEDGHGYGVCPRCRRTIKILENYVLTDV